MFCSPPPTTLHSKTMEPISSRKEILGLFCSKYGVNVENVGNEILYPPPSQHNASKNDSANMKIPNLIDAQAAVECITVNRYAMMADEETKGYFRLHKLDTGREETPVTTKNIAVASSYGTISSILLAMVSQALVIHKDEKGAFSFQIGAQPNWNARGIDRTKEREDHEFALAPYATKGEFEEKEALVMSWGDKLASRGWKECDAESYALMAKLYTDDASKFKNMGELDKAGVAMSLSEILNGILENYKGLATKESIQKFVAKLLELSPIDHWSTGALNWECIHDLVFIAKVLWVGLELPSFAAIGGRHRLFTLCHLLLGWKATTNGSTHECLEAKLPNTLIWYQAPIQIVVGRDEGLLRSFSLQLQDQTKHTIPIILGNFMIDVLGNCQKRSNLDALKKGPDTMKLFWDATIMCLKSNEAYRELTKAVPGNKSSLLDITLDSRKRNKKLWNSFMKFLSKGKYMFPARETNEPVTTMLIFSNSTSFAKIFPELKKEITDVSLKKLESLDLYLNSIINFVTPTLMTYYIWSVRNDRQPNPRSNGDIYTKLILDHRLGSILFWALTKWGLEIQGKDQNQGKNKPLWIDPEPISKDSTIKSNLFCYFQRMTLLLESGRYNFDHNFDGIQVKNHVSVIANMRINSLLGCPPKMVLAIGMTTLAIPPFPFQTAKDEKSEVIFGCNLSDKELCDWVRLSKLHETPNVHVFTISDDKCLNNHPYGFHPHLHKESNTKDVHILVERARDMLKSYGLNGFDQICFDYFIGQTINARTSTICELAKLLSPGGALYMLKHKEDWTGEVGADDTFREARLKVEDFKLGSEHWLWNATNAVPPCFLKSSGNSSIESHLKISIVSTKENARLFTINRFQSNTDHQPAAPEMLPPAGKRDAELATSNPNENGFEMDKAKDVRHKHRCPGNQTHNPGRDGSQEAKDDEATNNDKAAKNANEATKPLTASESPTALESPAAPATPESPAAPKPPTASAKKPKTRRTDSKYFKRGETRTSNAVWKMTNAKLLDTAYPPPYLKGVLYMLWYLHGGGLFTKETLHSFQSCLLRWSEKEPNITEATRLEKIQEQVGSFQDFHKHSLFLPNAKHPFNFVLMRPELLKGVASHLKIQAEKMVWKPIEIDPFEASNS
ncbi:unnamed protein product [Cylindrotheca closterium]|uniref:Uncharacterized protein n=1 Tax=Cylindrotheca closterium TaxID=2856 RepID=A0AAD2FNL1_9STRA|nr:unnamed protein product [Cylindrotheca closterium]